MQPEADTQAEILEILKYLGIFVSLVSGMVATAFETKVDDGKESKKLSRFGRLVFCCVVLGSLISAGTQLVEDHQQHVTSIKAANQREQDIKRISFIIDGTQRIAYRLTPLEWRVTVRYRITPGSNLEAYVNRISEKGKGFDLLGRDRPSLHDPKEADLWRMFSHPPVYIGILTKELWNTTARTMAVPIINGVSVLYDARVHSDPSIEWKPGPDATAPAFAAQSTTRKRDGEEWLEEMFVTRDSPEATWIHGAISPLDLAGDMVVAETPSYVVVDKVQILFPSAIDTLNIQMKRSPTVMYASRSVGTIDDISLRKALNVAEIPK
jgi:hypothetical protein